MIADWRFYALAVPAVLLMGISKGGFGAGIGVLSVPMLALVISPAQAAAIMLPILCVMDLMGLRAYRGQWDRRAMRILLPCAVLGIAVGALTFRWMNDRTLALIVGIVAVGFVLQAWTGAALRRVARPPGTAAGAVWGTLSGFTSFIANAGGPPLAMYLLPQRLDKTVFVGTTVVFFTIVNWVKLPPYLWLGLFTAENLLTALMLMPAAPLGMFLGLWLHGRVETTLFYRLSYGFLLVTGGKLIFDGLFAPGGLLH